MKIRRFDVNPWIEDGEAHATFEVSPSGAWVSYADHTEAIATRTERAEKERAALRDEVRMWRAADRLPAGENATGDGAVGMAETRHTLHRAMAATDAAGILCDHVTLKPGHDHDDPDPYMPVRDGAKGAE